MKKDILMWAGTSTCVMIIFPLLEIIFVNQHSSMIALMFTMLVINPIYFVVLGIFSGRKLKKLWSITLISIVLFLIGAFTIHGMDKSAMIFYSVIYFSIGIITMFITTFVMKKVKNL